VASPITLKSRNKQSQEQETFTIAKTRRVTAGTGFGFEDQVAAWCLLRGLLGEPLPGVTGKFTRLQMQTSQLGWLLDDILVTVVDQAAGEHRLAISCKANVQVSSSGLPADFVSAAWDLWNAGANGPMRRGSDALMLATRIRHAGFEAVWSDLKSWATGADENFALRQMRGTATHKKALSSIEAHEARGAATDADALALLCAIDVMPFDFDTAAGHSERACIREARTLLASSDATQAEELWAALVDSARDTRLGNGTLEFTALLKTLRVKFALKDHPDFEASWRKLGALSSDHLVGIEAQLPSGVVLKRQAEQDGLSVQIAASPVVLVHGESGTGKSALVKAVLHLDFSAARQVWLGTDVLARSLSEADRIGLGLDHPLIDVLEKSSAAQNILVVDGAERIAEATAPKLRALIKDLQERNADTADAWRVVIVGQTEAWATGKLQGLVDGAATRHFEVKSVSETEAAAVLSASPGLEWLAAHDEAVATLTNLRTLAWVIQATASFAGGRDQAASLSLVSIADRLWGYWTDGKTPVKQLLIHLAERDGAFEHGVRISQLPPADAAAFDQRPQHCPVRLRQDDNRVLFEHDLAADWARFQQLKEIGDDIGAWAQFAGNPMWNGALRMLGQHLLRRERGGRNAWDAAFADAQLPPYDTSLSADILLDSLFLDPEAGRFLEDRREMLFADNGKQLLRLLRRFDHVGSAVAVPEMLVGFQHLSLYMEAQFRVPIYGRWPALVRFLAAHEARVAALISPVVAKVCERWLTGTPALLAPGQPTPLRKELASLALATARALQLALAKRVIFLGDGIENIYQAAFAGAMDLPEEVSAWALEMACRRPLRADIVGEIEQHRREEAEEHRQRLQDDPDYRARHDRARRASMSISSQRKLPPWPLGASGRVDNNFREATLGSTGFRMLMHAAPEVASEVLLAAIIEDQPEEHYGSRLRDDLGLSFDSHSYPTAYWKSAFYSFLSINAEAALDALLKLVSFCTERWESHVTSPGDPPLPHQTVTLADGTPKIYRGGARVFCWSQENATHTGQLYSALAALERWLYERIDKGEDVTPHLERLLRETDSVAIVGVFVNIGKYRPAVFSGVLKPLLAVYRFYMWDERRVRDSQFFDGMTWARSGDTIFEMAKAWHFAPHRKATLHKIVCDRLVSEPELSEFVLRATEAWKAPEADKASVEFRILVAQLDYRNWRRADGEEERFEFVCPQDVEEAIREFQAGNARAQQILFFPDQCRSFLATRRALTDDEATNVAALMAAADSGETVELEDAMKRPAALAAAVTLLLRAEGWLRDRSDVADHAQRLIDAAMAELSDDADGSRHHYSTSPSYLEFVAWLVAERWIAASSATTDEALMRILTGGDDRAVEALSSLLYPSRAALGERWWRFLYLALLFAGLSMVVPRVTDDNARKSLWARRRRWLVTRSLAVQAAPSILDPLNIAKRVERFERRMWRERYARDDRSYEDEPERRLSGGLDTHFLKIVFGWLISEMNGGVPPEELLSRRELVARFWAHEAWHLSGSAEDEDRDFGTMDQWGYALVDEASRLILVAPLELGTVLWKPILALGPRGHYALEAFFRSWFGLCTETTDVAAFGMRWRAIIKFVLSGEAWPEHRNWHYGRQLERQALGFGSTDFLIRMPGCTELVGSMREFYRDWAVSRLGSDEDELAGLCGFLDSKAGVPLRKQGLLWITEAMKSNTRTGKWYRDRTGSAFVSFLDTVVSESLSEVAKDEPARQALLELIGHAVARQLPAALALQERAKGLLRAA